MERSDDDATGDRDRPLVETRRSRRRWPLIVGLVAVVLGILASLGWYVWLPEYRPSLHDGERYGIDVSRHQGAVDWDRVAADGIAFAYIKATEGGDHSDGRFGENWRGAHRSGVERGAYHFFTLCTPGSVQARHFLRVVPREAGLLPPAVDLELAGNCSARPPARRVYEELKAFLEAVESETGQRVVLYVGDDFERRYPVRATLGRPLWHRRVLLRPDVEGWWIWQVMGYAHVDGIGGDVDLNVMRTKRSLPSRRAGHRDRLPGRALRQRTHGGTDRSGVAGPSVPTCAQSQWMVEGSSHPTQGPLPEAASCHRPSRSTQ